MNFFSAPFFKSFCTKACCSPSLFLAFHWWDNLGWWPERGQRACDSRYPVLAEDRNPPKAAAPECWKDEQMKLCQTNLTHLLPGLWALGSGVPGRADVGSITAPWWKHLRLLWKPNSLPVVSHGCCRSWGPALLQELRRTASGFTARKKYEGSSTQRHLIKYPFRPRADLQEGSEWPSGGFRLPISTGRTPGCVQQ